MVEFTKHYLISGRVQGVGYRAYTRRAAADLGLRGWVRNLADGRVEALAMGGEESLRLFEVKLKSGPAHGEVESLVDTLMDSLFESVVESAVEGVSVGERQLREKCTDFAIRKDSREPCCEN